MKQAVAILIGKLFSFVGKIIHRGSTYPGYIALKIDKDILNKFELPEISVVVTGSSGKTSTSYTIAHILKENGYTVAHNKDGANLRNGLATLLVSNSNLKGKITKDAFVMELDERYTKELLPIIKPKYLVICNITRDQPPRQGHFDYVFNIIKEGISDDMHLVLNGDDPLVNKFALNHQGPASYFGICRSDDSFPSLMSNSLDMVYCPICHHKLQYDYVSFSNVGAFSCSNCDFKRPKLNYEITSIDKQNIVINNEVSFTAKTNQVYTYYNYIAAYSVGALVGIPPEKIAEAMGNISYYEKRYSHFQYDGRDGYILSGKNENAPSYNQAMNYVGKKEEEKTIIFGFEYISLRYSFEDISWLYDIDFEMLKNDTISHFICVGPFANDIATRAYLAGIDKEKIIIAEQVANIYGLLQITSGNIYAILNLGTDKKFIHSLNEHSIEID